MPSWRIAAERLSAPDDICHVAVTGTDLSSLSGHVRLEETGLIEERSRRLLEALEGRTETLVGLLHAERSARQAQQLRLTDLERRLAELEANRLELLEENRELDEQNRELEEHNRHLHQKRVREAGESAFPRPAHRSQGLSALIGRRPGTTTTVPRPSEARDPLAEDVAQPPVGARLAGRSKEAAATPSAATEASLGRSASHETPPVSQQDRSPVGEAPSPQALLGEWYQRYGSAFFKGHTRPLKVGIHEELAAREPWPEKLVRRALACYVNLPRYLKAVREGAERIDLNGQPAGRVDAQAAEHAHRKLDRLQADRRPTRHKPAKQGKPAKRGRADGDRKASPGDGVNTGNATPPRPAAAPASDSPASLDEKLTALLAKHNGR